MSLAKSYSEVLTAVRSKWFLTALLAVVTVLAVGFHWPLPIWMTLAVLIFLLG
jgi:hypothetical protein